MKEPRFYATAAEFRQWLELHASSATELIVGFHKGGSNPPSMSWSESVDEALCHGWIDGVRRRIDKQSYSIRFTPRKRSSIWSAINIDKFNQLEAAGRVKPAGLNAFSHRTEERSVVYAHEQEKIASLSDEEEREFKKHQAAWHFLESTPPSYRKVVLHWVVSAKRPETRAARIKKLFDACSAGVRLR
jgi:uncharacterized protein YdeI (YjbR/CyaY-like superfamily)